MIAHNINMKYGLTGASAMTLTACSTGVYSVIWAAMMIEMGMIDHALAGSVDKTIHPDAFKQMGKLRALTTKFNDTPEKASRPYDTQRDGLVLSEGGAIFLLSKDKTDNTICQIDGYAVNNDAYQTVAPHPNGEEVQKCMAEALKGKTPSLINVHGTSTPMGDYAELDAINRLGLQEVPITANKSQLGHCMGAAGSVELAMSIMSLKHAIIPPTVNVEAVEEGYSPNGQLPKGGKVDYEFLVYNQGNTRDIFTVEIDDSDLPSGWEATLKSQSEIDLTAGLYGYIQVRVEAPVSAPGGSKEKVTVTVKSSGNSNILDQVRLETTVRTYGVVFLSSPDEVRIDPEQLDIDGYYTFNVNLRNTGSDRDTYKLDATTARSDWTIRVEIDGNEVSAVTIDKSSSQKIDIVVRPVNYDNILGEEVNFVLTADSISPGDGSATLSASIIMEIPLDKISDLSVSLDDVLINGKPHAILTESDVKASEPVQIQLTVFNKGGQSTGSFTVKLYEGSRVIDEYNLVQGVSGFGSEFVILQWENPSSGSKTLKIYVDFEQQVTESNNNRFDNSITLPLVIAEKSSSSGDNSSDDPLLYGPSHVLTILALVIFTTFTRRRA